jgi:hypothetical protein
MRTLGISGDWLKVTDESGKVTERTRQCLELIAKHEMVLATAHISPAEMAPVVKAAGECGVKRIVVTHPEFPTTCLSIDQQRELQKLDVFFERCFTTPYSGKISWDHVIHNIRTIGPSTTILATDLGQSHNPHVDEGLRLFIEKVLEAGISERDVERMVRENPSQMLA